MKRALVFALLLIAACGGPKSVPEEEIRAWLATAQERAEGKERRDLVDMISPAYADARNNKRDDIDGTLRIYFFRQNSIELVTKIDPETELANRVCVINRGQIYFDGSIQEVAKLAETDHLVSKLTGKGF